MFRRLISRTPKLTCHFYRSESRLQTCSTLVVTGVKPSPYYTVQKVYVSDSVKVKFGHQRRICTPQRGNLFTMKIDSPEFHSIFTPELRQLEDLFKKYKYELRIAGGPVRDLLMGKVPTDIDLATTATPQQMIEMFKAEGIRMINKKGEKHGTVTCRINDKENFEVTTLRIDVVTDGRHAEVEFTKDWELDANRRDLTINSMFLDFDGTVYDYFSGKKDLEKRHVRFVGNADARIKEDYLRILRYFRFYGRIVPDSHSHDEDTLLAIKDNATGLQGIAGERLWMEMKKILVGNFAPDIVRKMKDVGVLQHIGFPADINVEELERIYDKSKDYEPSAMTYVAALLKIDSQLTSVNMRLKLSNDEAKLAYFLLRFRDDVPEEKVLKYCKDLHIELDRKEPKIKSKILELLKYTGNNDIIEEFSEWTPPKFPVNGRMLVEQGIKGKNFTLILDVMRKKWIDSDYALTEGELLNDLDNIKQELDIKI